MIEKEVKLIDDRRLCLVFCTIDNYLNAMYITERILIDRVAVCVSIIPKIKSVYIWNNQIKNDKEILLLIKVFKKNQSILFEKIKKNHPYDIPEIISIDIDKIDFNYLGWAVGVINKN